MRKVSKGLGLTVAAMFTSFELEGVPEEIARINGLLAGRSPAELKLVERVLATLFEELDRDSGSEADNK
ncbi:hypothetical protein ENSA7_76890 [Enhygromyxa salina]|uniref:Uncharacterized protein n=1 Tax=Enhygromyxa salina TaxID=215803 RepID=A0A2S9XPT2_9BACT|nr:hypothetical protein ENSA7_76890 [Enhygromyxa salina]